MFVQPAQGQEAYRCCLSPLARVLTCPAPNSKMAAANNTQWFGQTVQERGGVQAFGSKTAVQLLANRLENLICFYDFLN